MNPLDVRDEAIIDSFPVLKFDNKVLNVGCGEGRIDSHLSKMGYRVYATDMKRQKSWRRKEKLTFHVANIFDLKSFPIKSASVVICSQVLEHLKDYKKALKNLLKLTEIRLIITVPYKKSFNDPTHCNYWDDTGHEEYMNINYFTQLCSPYSVAISKIRTKKKDVKKRKYNYLIVVNKRHNLMNPEGVGDVV